MNPLRMISSMATRQVLLELIKERAASAGPAVALEAVGGVDAARRVQAGEAFDVVVLAEGALGKLVESGCVHPASVTALVRSGVSVAVRAGVPRPDIGTEQALKAAVLAARSLGYSTGPSGNHLLQTFDRWGITDALRDRIVQAPPGVPVAKLVAEGQVELGFQQLSELLGVAGIEVVGPLPPGVQLITTFSGGVVTSSAQVQAARALLDFMASPAADAAKRRQGMSPA